MVFGKLLAGLKRTRKALVSGLRSLLPRGPLDAATLDRVEELLYTADLGPAAAELVGELRTAWKRGEVATTEQVEPFLKARILKLLRPAQPASADGPRPRLRTPVSVLPEGARRRRPASGPGREAPGQGPAPGPRRTPGSGSPAPAVREGAARGRHRRPASARARAPPRRRPASGSRPEGRREEAEPPPERRRRPGWTRRPGGSVRRPRSGSGRRCARRSRRPASPRALATGRPPPGHRSAGR